MVQPVSRRSRTAWPHANVHDVVTLASIVERETAVDDERPTVASVFVNRLAAGMPLMTGSVGNLWAPARGQMARNHLPERFNAPHRVQHLPAQRNASRADRESGAKSLHAAMDPATTIILLCRGRRQSAGTFGFSRSLEEQKQAVEGYRAR